MAVGNKKVYGKTSLRRIQIHLAYKIFKGVILFSISTISLIKESKLHDKCNLIFMNLKTIKSGLSSLYYLCTHTYKQILLSHSYSQIFPNKPFCCMNVCSSLPNSNKVLTLSSRITDKHYFLRSSTVIYVNRSRFFA